MNVATNIFFGCLHVTVVTCIPPPTSVSKRNTKGKNSVMTCSNTHLIARTSKTMCSCSSTTSCSSLFLWYVALVMLVHELKPRKMNKAIHVWKILRQSRFYWTTLNSENVLTSHVSPTNSTRVEILFCMGNICMGNIYRIANFWPKSKVSQSMLKSSLLWLTSPLTRIDIGIALSIKN